jgi:hypothetical protein
MPIKQMDSAEMSVGQKILDQNAGHQGKIIVGFCNKKQPTVDLIKLLRQKFTHAI